MDEPIPILEKPNGKTLSPEAWSQDHRFKYSKDTIERILRLKASGVTYLKLHEEFKIPVTTLQFWAKREKQAGTELGKQLCNDVQQERERKARPETVSFPGGSVYQRAAGGKAVLQDAAAPPHQAEHLEESFVDEVLEEIAYRLGRKEIEIVTLRLKLQKKP